MKKFLVTVLALLYITITSGVMVNVHYCMGEVASVKYGVDSRQACGNCGMEKQEGCCHVDHQFIKSGDQQTSSSYAVQVPLQAIATAPDHSVSPVALNSASPHEHSLYHSPPNGRHNSIYIFNGVFRV